MADKFLSRPDGKQRILRLDVSPVMPANESALVVTAEATRLTYFASDPSGVWQFATREHDALGSVAAGPDDTLAFPWSRRNGVAAWKGLGVVAFKRSIRGQVGLFVDVVGLDAGIPELKAGEPVAVPLDRLGIVGVGIDVWARFVEDELLIVTQGWVRGRLDLVGPQPPEPRLLLLRCPLGQVAPQGLADPAVWTVHVLDRGGYDLDVRVEPGRLWAAHRRSGAATSREVEHYEDQGDVIVWIVDDPENPFDLNLNALVGEYPPVVIVSFDFASGQPEIEADDLPGVERPQLHSVDPIIVTGDRLHYVEVRIEHDDRGRRFVPRVYNASKWVIWRFRERWLTDTIGHPRHQQWPLNLEEIAGSQYMVEVQGERVSLGTLASLQPVVLADIQETDKGRILAFVIEDPQSGALVTDFYRMGVFTGPDESLRWEGRNVLDIGHETIVRAPDDQGNETPHPAEHTQFLPFFMEAEGAMASGDLVRARFGGPLGPTATRNTLGGLLVGDQDLRVGLLAYAGMDDGGGRVVFAPGVDPLPPRTGEPYKIFPPEIVVDPIAPGRAWVTLRADDWIDAHLPGYFVPTNDMLRRAPVPSNVLEILGLMMAESILVHFTPRSIGSGLQLPLDALPIANLLTPGTNATIEDVQPEVFELDRDRASEIQVTLAGQAPPSRVFRSDSDAAFPVSFTFAPGVAQAGLALTFTAVATPPGGGAAFAWTFAPPEDIPGFNVLALEDPAPEVVFPIDGNWTVTLVATAADGTTSTVNRTLRVAPSLWTQVWEPQRSISNDTVTVGSTTLAMSKFRIDYVFNAQGRRTLVRVGYLDEHRTQLRFLPGVDQQQGRIGLRMPFTISSEDAAFTGALGGILKLNRMDVAFSYERRFTPSISTSDRRSFDLTARRTYAQLDSVPGAPVTPRQADVETIRKSALSQERITRTTPSAIAARPVDLGELRLDDVRMDTDLSDGAGTVVSIFSVIVALGLAGLFIGPIIAAIAVASGPLAPVTVLVTLALVALVAIAVGLGLGAWLRGLARGLLTDFVTGVARGELSRPENLASIREGLDAGGMMTYAGEGLSEAIAIMALRQALDDGHAVEPPHHDQPDPEVPGATLKASGRERFREQAFETIAVGEGVCRVLLRIQ